MAVEKTEGISQEEARKKVFLKDSKGLIVKNRSTGGINHHKEPFAHDHPEMTDLVKIDFVMSKTLIDFVMSKTLIDFEYMYGSDQYNFATKIISRKLNCLFDD